MKKVGLVTFAFLALGLGSAWAQVPHPHPIPLPLPHPHPGPHPHPVPMPHPVPHPIPVPHPVPHPMPHPVPGPVGGCNDPYYTNARAYAELRAAENSDSDADGNFQIVRQADMTGRACLKDAVQAFLLVQAAEGGSLKTGDARSAYSAVTGWELRAYPLVQVAQEYARIRRSENDGAGALSGFRLVARAVTAGHQLFVASNAYVQILSSEGGSLRTADALNAFELLLQFNAPGMNLQRLSNAYLQIRRAENTAADALENMRLIRLAVLRGHPLERTVSDFLSILASKGGALQTAAAQATFRMIYQL